MGTLRVLEIFDSLQGEGYWTGIPMTFIRLAGCNGPDLALGCVAWCDTPESWDPTAGETMETLEVVRRACLPRLCLTGGEPLVQLESVKELVAEAHGRDIRVHLETNGTLAPPRDGEARFDWVVVSPKPPEYQIAPGWHGLIDELKLVVDEDLEATTVERLAAANPEAVVFLQPASDLDSTDAEREDSSRYRQSCSRAMALVMGHPEWRLSLQVHKLLGIR